MNFRGLLDQDRTFFYKILYSSNSSILITDALAPDNPIIFVNRAFEDITGYTANDVIGKNCRFLQGEDRNQAARYLLAQAIAKGEPCEYVLRNYRKDGQMFWNKLYIFPVADDEGVITHFVGIQHDVTESISLQSKLQEQGEQLARMHAEAQAANIRLAEKRKRLAHMLQNLQRLSAQLVDTQEQERKNLASELHDELGQQLTALNFALHALQPFLSAPAALKTWDQAVTNIAYLLTQVRQISTGLHPPALELLPFDVAIKQMIERQFVDTGIVLSIKLGEMPATLPDRIKITTYRVLQESMTNILRHANARNVAIAISVCKSEEELDIAIQDNGRGFEPPASKQSLRSSTGCGIRNMRERVELLGGILQIDSKPGHGTCVAVRLPISSSLPPETN